MTVIRYIVYVLLGLIFIFYMIHTYKYAKAFSRNTSFEGRRKLFHSIMIWIFPFCWILILKSYLKPLPGSADFPDKFNNPDFRENFGPGTWSGGS